MLAGGNIAPEQVRPCDFRAAGGIDQARLAPLISSTEALALTLTQSLSSTLGMTCEATLQSSEQVACQTFLEKVGISYLVSIQVGSLQPGAQTEMALLQIDPVLLFPVVDRLLGGSGEATDLSREVTEIEDHIAKDFVRLICQELQKAWRRFNVSVALGARQEVSQMQRTFSPQDNAIVFSFAVTMQSAGGGFQLMLPVASLGGFLVAKTTSAQEITRKGTMSPKLAEKALDWTFEVELSMLEGKIRASDLLNLTVGKILQLGVSVRTPVVLKIGGHEAFEAVPVRSGNHRGAQLLDRLQQNQAETEPTP